MVSAIMSVCLGVTVKEISPGVPMWATSAVQKSLRVPPTGDRVVTQCLCTCIPFALAQDRSWLRQDLQNSFAGRCGGENRQLIVEGTLVGGPRLATGDIGGQVRILLQYARSAQPAQHRHH